MNQILVSEKIYVTPEMKIKKRLYKIEFFVSIFLLCIFSSYCIYAEYDRNKSEQVSKEILANLEFKIPQKQKKEEKLETIVVVLNSAFNNVQEIDAEAPDIQIEEIPEMQVFRAKDGTEYYTIGTINIPELNIYYPILSETTEELLKNSPCKFWGADPNEVGNFCIVGHNYRNSKFFSKISTLQNGAIIEITDLSGQIVQYEVYDNYTVDPENTDCTSQNTNGNREITVITCTNDSKHRTVIKAREI